MTNYLPQKKYKPFSINFIPFFLVSAGTLFVGDYIYPKYLNDPSSQEIEGKSAPLLSPTRTAHQYKNVFLSEAGREQVSGQTALMRTDLHRASGIL